MFERHEFFQIFNRANVCWLLQTTYAAKCHAGACEDLRAWLFDAPVKIIVPFVFEERRDRGCAGDGECLFELNLCWTALPSKIQVTEERRVFHCVWALTDSIEALRPFVDE